MLRGSSCMMYYALMASLYLMSIGMRSMIRLSSSPMSAGMATPGRLGSASSKMTSSEEMQLSTSMRNGPLNPMLIGMPSYSHMRRSSADVE